MTIEALSSLLHRRWPEDVAQEALVAFLTQTHVDNPIAFCSRVARRALNHQRRTYNKRMAQRSSTPYEERRVIHVSPGPDEDRRRDAVFGGYEPEQERRLEAREALDRLHTVDILKGLGYLDPPPQDLPKLTRGPRKRWTRARGGR